MQVLKLYDTNPNMQTIDEIVAVLKNGGVIIYPTDTVYAMGCDIFNQRAVERICKYKKIDPRKAHLSFVSHDISQLSQYAKIDNRVFKLLKRNLPGPFTFILNGSNKLPKLYKGRKTVGIRIPNNAILFAILKEFGHPMMTTSLTDMESISEYETDPSLMSEKYEPYVDMIVDGGIGGVEVSTVVDCTSNECEIVRQGNSELLF